MNVRRLQPSPSRAVARLRRKGWFSVLVLFLALIGQAAHTHGDGVTGLQAQHQSFVSATDLTADTCPLCVAMHSATPAVVATEPAPERVETTEVSQAAERFIQAPPGHAHYSRPPPLS